MVNKENHSNFPTHYILICEIGPITEYLQESRKTIDFWGASFIFSYMMAEVAKKIEELEGIIFLPYLKDDPLVSGKGRVTGNNVQGIERKVSSGTVPDRIYAIINEKQKEEIPHALKTVVPETIQKILEGFKKDKSFDTINLDINEATEFFNFFFIFHEIKSNKPGHQEFLEAEKKIVMRYALRPFEKTSPIEIKKWEKCDLCGKRKKVYDIQKDYTPGAMFHNIERICSVCLLKRKLHEIIPKLLDDETKFIEPKYKSTSDIAAIPLNAHLEKLKDLTDCYDEVQSLAKNLKEEYKGKLEKEGLKTKKRIDYDEGRSFFDVSLPLLNNFRKIFEKCEETVKETDKSYMPLKWLDRPFFCVVYMDADNMSENLKANEDNFLPYIEKVSEVISNFSRNVYDIVTKNYHGQLIFAGGEDISFVIHPEYLLDCIKDLTTSYNSSFLNEELTKPDAHKFTLSAGVVVAYHKYPLSRVIENAHQMLISYAKNHPKKNATAISLIKGHTEVFNFTISNNLINNVIELKKYLLQSDISRTTPYRITEAKELLKTISDDESRKNYLRLIMEATRTERNREIIDKLVDILMEFRDVDTMINVLLFTRFLAGEKYA
ncbi:MAG: hypothetical protein DDT22_00609 [candidate division WS2 bacterium]|nr:hypothetical protein [Candidatus Lithacetigena glycinireducens]